MTATGISFHRESIEVLAATAVTDRYGNDTLDWDTAGVVIVEGCRLLPQSGTEAGERMTHRWMLFAPPGTVLRPANRVRWAGQIYEVIGEVRQWGSPAGGLAHLEADLQRVEG